MIISLLLAAVFFFSTPLMRVEALTIPSFPSCENPQGRVKTANTTGTHGIVGSTDEFTGTDTVYSLTADTQTQCFCSKDKDGIQTDWWKASSLSDSEIAVMKRDGWIFIPNGALWGLENTPYLAKNSDYACGDTPRIGGAYADNILGLATTGNDALLVSSLSIAIAAFFLGLILRNRQNAK